MTLAEVHGQQWTRVEHLLASIIDALGVVAYNALVGPHADPKRLRRVKPPTPIARPGVRHRRRASGAETAAFFARARGKVS